MFKPRKSGKIDKKDHFTFRNRGIPHRTPQVRIYVPSANVHAKEWVRLAEKTSVDQCKWKTIHIGAWSSYDDNFQTSKKYPYTSKNHLGKNAITMTQWIRHQRKKNDVFEVESLNKSDSVKAVKHARRTKGMSNKYYSLLYHHWKSKKKGKSCQTRMKIWKQKVLTMLPEKSWT